MSYQETRVGFPDLKKPVTTVRPLSISFGKEGVKQLEGIPLIILVNACLYVVREDYEGLRAGDILSRNLFLTREKNLNVHDLESQLFVRYRSIYDARRAIKRIDPRYAAVEIPELVQWGLDADKLLRDSWTLHRASAQEEAVFVWRADRRVQRHRYDRAQHKVDARDRFAKIATIQDRTGRRNPSSIPLQCLAADRELITRIQEVRGIGRRMDWRGIVLEHLIDQLLSECRLIARGAQDALTSEDIFGEKRTPKTLRKRAQRMRQYVIFLSGLRIRTFDRSFRHIVRELDEASEFLIAMADERATTHLSRVRELLVNTYHSTQLAQEHWRMQEVLLVVAALYHDRGSLSFAQRTLFLQELEDILRTLKTPDSVTGTLIGSTFVREVLPDVRRYLDLAQHELRRVEGVDMAALYEHLKAAVQAL